MVSPYSGIPVEKWSDKTKELIEEHPLKPNVIREIALRSWNLLWQTKIGEEDTYLSLAEIDPPAIMVGYFFEKLFAKELQKQLKPVTIRISKKDADPFTWKKL